MKNDKSGPRLDYAAEYVIHNTPDTMLAGQISTVQMTVLNPSSRTWLEAGTNPVHLG